MPLEVKMSEPCSQCGFTHARIDTEAWGVRCSKRVMCPICGWTLYEEYNWENGNPVMVKRSESPGFGAYRLIPPGGFAGYNAFYSEPSEDTLALIRALLTQKGWKGYLSLWDAKDNKPYLVLGSPLAKFDAMDSK